MRPGAAGVAVVVGVAVAAGGVTWARASHHAAVAVTSTGPSLASLEDLVRASDVVVIARARSVAPGRVFSSGEEGLRSEIVELQVGAVLHGTDPGPTIALEEESTTVDDAPLVVDGLRPTRAGDEGVFFLVASADRSVPYYATVSTSGRFLRRSSDRSDDGLLAADTDLGRRLGALGGRALTDAVLAVRSGRDAGASR